MSTGWAEETSNVTEISTTELSEGANTPSELSQLYLSSIFTTEVQTNTFEISTEISKVEISDTSEISKPAKALDFSSLRKLLTIEISGTPEISTPEISNTLEISGSANSQVLHFQLLHFSNQKSKHRNFQSTGNF